MDDFEFSYIGESADQDDLNEDFEPWSTCVNVEGGNQLISRYLRHIQTRFTKRIF